MVQELEIHHINVIGGDATLILVTEGDDTLFRGLIDSGAEGGGTSSLWDYLEKIGESEKDRPDKKGNADACNLDLLICTHFHSDHIKGFGYSSNFVPRYFLLSSKQQGATDTSPTYPDVGATVNPSANSLSVMGQFQSLVAEDIADRIPLPFTNMDEGAPGSIELSTLVPAMALTALRMNIVAANGIVAGLGAKRTGTATNRIDTFALPINDPNRVLRNLGAATDEEKALARARYVKNTNPNDYSISTFIEFGNFTFLTTGDLSGAAAVNHNTAYKNVEQPLISSLETAGWIKDVAAGAGIDAVKIAHHGSNNSTYVASDSDTFLKKVRPDAMVVPSNQKKGVPGGSFLARASAYLVEERPNASGDPVSAGMLMANETEFVDVEDPATYAALNLVRAGSTVATGIVPGAWAQRTPFNLPEFPRERGLSALSNLPNAAVILCANSDGSRVDLSVEDFGNAVYCYDNFTLLMSTIELSTATTAASSSARKFKLPDIPYAELFFLEAAGETLFYNAAEQFYWKAWEKVVSGGTAGHGYTYIKKYAPITFGFFTWKENEFGIDQADMEAYCTASAPVLMAVFYRAFAQNIITTAQGNVYRYDRQQAGVDTLTYAELQTMEYALQEYIHDNSLSGRAVVRMQENSKIRARSGASVSSHKAVVRARKKRKPNPPPPSDRSRF